MTNTIRAALGAMLLQVLAPAALAEVPEQAGQGAFAAIVEIVALLEADPATDWGRVDIAALQAHLADMDAVVLRSRVSESAIDGGLEMTVTGDGPTAAAIQRMVTAHATELDALDDFVASAAEIPAGAILRVTSADPLVATRIRGLGFYGLLATGAHHQAHHLAVATGHHPHGH